MKMYILETGDMMLDDLLIPQELEKEAFALRTEFEGETSSKAGNITTFDVINSDLGQDLYMRIVKIYTPEEEIPETPELNLPLHDVIKTGAYGEGELVARNWAEDDVYNNLEG